MPWFRFIDEANVTLRFSNGTCNLTFANLGGGMSWAWVAQKRDSNVEPIVLVRAGNGCGILLVEACNNKRINR